MSNCFVRFFQVPGTFRVPRLLLSIAHRDDCPSILHYAYCGHEGGQVRK